MSEHVRRAAVTFAQPFFVEGLGREQSAGTYEVEIVEEPLEGLSFLAHRIVSTSIRIPRAGRGANSWQLVPIAVDVVRAAVQQAENKDRDDLAGGA